MIILNNKKADGIYPLSYLYQPDNDSCYEVSDYLITDGAVDEFMSDCRSINHTMCDSGEIHGIEVFKVVEITNASYTIIQKIKDGEVKLALVNTLLKSEDKIDKLTRMAAKTYYEEYENLESMNLVKKVRIR